MGFYDFSGIILSFLFDVSFLFIFLESLNSFLILMSLNVLYLLADVLFEAILFLNKLKKEAFLLEEFYPPQKLQEVFNIPVI
jgi:hypothetical protein